MREFTVEDSLKVQGVMVYTVRVKRGVDKPQVGDVIMLDSREFRVRESEFPTCEFIPNPDFTSISFKGRWVDAESRSE